MAKYLKEARKTRSLLLLLGILTVAEAQYQWTIFDQDHIEFCSDRNTCNGRPHTMCYEANQTHPRCKKFKPLVLDEKSIKSFMMGHNGLRNKVATNPQRPALDMQLLHWDSDLQAMAERWVRQCIVEYDECKFIGDPFYQIEQNIFFHPKPPLVHWEALALSTWFNEKEHHNPNLPLNALQKEDVSNYTQLIWARTQFVGCGAAEMHGGYLVVCYYYPRGNIVAEPVYTVGPKPCTGCPQERASCSHVFRGLCGIDDRHSAAYRSNPRSMAMAALMMLLLVAHNRIRAFNPC
ncbi:venom allergen 5-like [Anopheles ziemanni]|uniref:venom allergen 5-like n=1 Tax=Anopheles coustani TaxID=139045 RepID=UPI00265A5A55|nr:venom allergen 5-like [Anopheles coustani]XP_058169828.1 venom allergen 5-like [Anopheles ziemanni]